MPQMSAQAARDLVELLSRAGAPVWVDGGWAVDALVGRQTREHEDLDIAIDVRHLATARRALESAGFRDVERDDTRAWNFVMGHPDGREVDFHVIQIDEAGNGIYGPPENDDLYPAATLSGHGLLDGRPVRCLSAEGLIAFRVEYPHPPRDRDYHDVQVICEHFGFETPEKYRSDLSQTRYTHLPSNNGPSEE